MYVHAIFKLKKYFLFPFPLDERSRKYVNNSKKKNVFT